MPAGPSLVEALVARLELLPPSQWESALTDAGADPTVRTAVRDRLLADDDRADSGALIDPIIGGVAGLWAHHVAASAAASLIGHRVGAYEITGTLGQGGMGTVYRARRADGQFEQDVAIKLVRHGFETPAALERFRQERRILASLTHPSIARLLDGGTITGDGGVEIPYLVMEYVDGRSITAYCEAARLPVASRLLLVRRVCEAVQHAHQHFVVHRDLKPGNILITAGGEPRLLDFGIAKLVSDDPSTAPAVTATGLPLLTPDYASPEQLRAEPVTAATDVYALGAILYELLAGRKAHQFQTSSAAEMTRVICDTPVLRPSEAIAPAAPGAAKLRRQLAGDLDTIVMRALDKDPSRRYASVEQLSEDLGRHLAGLPVRARPDSAAYRAARFVRRNRLPVVAFALLVVSLAAGAIVSVWQARRAERRFAQVRTLANSLIYDVHDSVQDLPGSTRARQTIVTTGLEYLRALEREAAGDPGLQRDLAAAYLRIGDVQGGVLGSNLGDVKGALASYTRARDLLAAAGGAGSARAIAAADVKIGDGLSYHGDLGGAMTAYTRARDTIETDASRPDAHPGDVLQLAAVFQAMARVQGVQREAAAALENSHKALALRRTLTTRDPANAAWRDARASAEAEVSMALQRLGKPGEALPYARNALTAREQQAAEHPDMVGAQRSLILAYSHLADVLGNPTMPSLGDTGGAIALYRKMTEVAERLRAADASDRRARFDLANCLLRLGSALVATPDRREGIDRLEQSAQLWRELVAAEPRNNRVKVTLAFVEGRIAEALAGSRDAEAIPHFDRAIAVSHQVLEADASEQSVPVTLAAAHGGKALALARARRREAALAEGRRGVSVLENARRAQPGNSRALVSLAAGYATMAQVHETLAGRDGAEACSWLSRSRQTYTEAQSKGVVDRQAAADLARVERSLTGCMR